MNSLCRERDETMKTAIIYYSRHLGITKKLLDAIAAKHEVELIDATEVGEPNLSRYDLIGFASGIYYMKFHKSVSKIAENCLPRGKRVFLILTGGMRSPNFTKGMAKIIEARGAELVGEYASLGYDTFGPFKLIGGVAKGHPNSEEIEGAVAFFESLFSSQTS